ncbi:MAG: methyltransferase domain-containing protein [Gemmataceae bacterium]
MTPSDSVLAQVGAYYTARLSEHGPTPRGVDWNGAESQQLRFDQLLRACDLERPDVIGDYGCGYGALLDWLRERGFAGEFRGFDIAADMVAAAAARHAGDGRARFAAAETVLAGCDVVLASGIFNVRLSTPVADWEAYVRTTLDRIAGLAGRGFAFNILTSYSDADKRRDHLYYADPCVYFDLCKRRYSRHVALLHDYGLYEFTILVRRS